MIERRPVRLVAHDAGWAVRALQEAERIRAALGGLVIVVHHIGSTSIPGILAKPIIDLMPVVRSIAALDKREADVRALGYDWRGEFGIAGRRFCPMNDAAGHRIVHVHFFAPDSPEIALNLAFRDYLRAHAGEAHAYEIEKQRAAALHPEDPIGYTEEKGTWIRAAKARAMVWAAARR